MGWTIQPRFDKPYSKLAPIDQEDNRAAARRIPEIIALAGMTLLEKRRTRRSKAAASRAQRAAVQTVRLHLEHHLERLAEAEHDGWMRTKLQNDWRCGEPRDDAKKIHHALVGYNELKEGDKERDRDSVRHFPDIVSLAGYEIAFFGAEESA